MAEERGSLEHLGLWLSGLALALVALKLFVFSHGNVDTVASIVHLNGVAGLFGVILIALLPTAVLLLFMATGIGLAESIREDDPLHGPLGAFLVSVLLALPFAPLTGSTYTAFLVVVSVAYSLVARWWRAVARRHQRTVPFLFRTSGRPRIMNVRNSFVLALPLVALLIVFNESSWMPKERLQVGNTSVLGYVLSDQGPRWSVVEDGSRQVIFVDAGLISGRSLCYRQNERSILSSWIWPDSESHASTAQGVDRPIPMRDCS